MCAISSKSHDWDSSELEGKSANPTALPHKWLWFKLRLSSRMLDIGRSRMRSQTFVTLSKTL